MQQHLHYRGPRAGREREKGTKKISEEIIVENFPNMGREISPESAEGPIQDKSKEKHTKTDINQTIKN